MSENCSIDVSSEPNEGDSAIGHPYSAVTCQPQGGIKFQITVGTDSKILVAYDNHQYTEGGWRLKSSRQTLLLYWLVCVD
jgi:hypothetical protein